MKTLRMCAALLLAFSMPQATASPEALDERLDAAIAGDHRDPANRARDEYRHPRAALEFFGLTPRSTVVEIWPSRGWWTELLAPVLKPEGRYYAAGFALSARRTPQWRRTMQREFQQKLEARPDLYDAVVVTELSVPEEVDIAPPGSADLVLTFRNVHNWMKGDYAPRMFEVMARALEPGGTLGVVEHRAPPGTSMKDMKLTGYVTENHVISLARAAGLELDARSEINANPQDTADHPAGVWTLPPSLRYCRRMEDDSERDDCMRHYRAIGESDRMTLRFRKPGAAK
ncbi:MAG: methyltransferase [Halioglobus sp.]|nr:methyltransferase [Halioglobus sp.]